MAPKEPTRAQLSSKLAYHAQKPAFLQKLQNRMAGVADEDDEDEEFEYVGNGREPIPRRPRPAIPERPADDPGSADEDFDDERPQVVVLKEGKHLTAHEAENIRRKEKGLPPLPDPQAEALKRAEEAEAEAAKASKGKSADAGGSKAAKQGLSFSSSGKATSSKMAKRKAVGQPDEEEGEAAGSKSAGKKKAKKQNKKLLSFGDDA